MRMTRRSKLFVALGLIAVLVLAAVLIAGLCDRSETPAYAQTQTVSAVQEGEETSEDVQPAADGSTQESDPTGWKAIAAGIAIGLAAAAGAVGMGIAIAKTNEAIARQPEADGKLRSTFMLGLIFIETAIIYALVVAILIIFVL